MPDPMIILQKTVPELTASRLDRFLARAKRAAGLRGVVNVLLTSSPELRDLNSRFRGKDYPTDVLSFPPGLGDARFAGDIAISTDIAKENARRLGHTTADEIRILVLHGILHLAGYDHEADTGAMAAKEHLLRKKLRLPLGLIERTQEISSHQAVSRKNGKRTSKRAQAAMKRRLSRSAKESRRQKMAPQNARRRSR